jgi:hypothetical protein
MQQHAFKDRHAFGHDNATCGQGFLEWYAGLVVSLNTNYESCAMANLAAKQDTGKSHGQQPKRCNGT